MGPSLERISWKLPSDDPHSWRASLNQLRWMVGTPGTKNSVEGTPPYPLLTQYKLEPENPSSKESVSLSVSFDTPGIIESAIAHWEIINQATPENPIGSKGPCPSKNW